LRGKSPNDRSRSRSGDRGVRKSKLKHRDKERDKKHKKYKEKERVKDKERRSVLTGKKVGFVLPLMCPQLSDVVVSDQAESS